VDLKQIKELMAAMEKAGVKKLTIKEKTGYELHLEMQGEVSHLAHPVAQAAPVHFIPQMSRAHDFPAQAHMQAPSSPEEKTSKQRPEEKEGKYISSPMVGTFYSSPSPDDPAFIKIGDRVEENTVVCIIEAMKVMNEVKAGVSGVVAEICLENGHPVEFGTKLFRIV
jgi:acetyl-CoA carboxylase biotin carboxyl carrier protein